MKRLIFATAIAALIAVPAATEPYRDFTDLRTRATVGTTVIRAFPNARTPTFRLLLENRGPDFCIIWLEFAQRALPIDHFGPYRKFGSSNRRVLVEGPLGDDGSGSSGVEPDSGLIAMSF